MDDLLTVLKSRDKEAGSAALFVVVILPVILTVTILLIDVTGFQSHRALAQQHIDSAVAKAAKLLPNTVAARDFLKSELKGFENLVIDKSMGKGGMEISSSRVSLAVAGSYKASFSAFLPKINGEDLSFGYRHTASSRIAPSDNILIIADSNSMRPPAHTVWGSFSEWPASKFWNFVSGPNTVDLSELRAPVFWPDWKWGNHMFHRWTTQHCFNPVLSSVKFAAINLVDVLGASTESRLGVLHTPGDEGLGFSVTRPLAYPSDNAAEPEAKWAGYFELESLTGDEICSFIASPSVSDQWRYLLRDSPSGYGMPKGARAYCDPSKTEGVFGRLDRETKMSTECLNAVSLRQAIYWRSARKYPHTSNASNVYQAINEAYLQITTARANSNDVAKTRIIVLTDALPDPSESDTFELFQRIHAYGTRVILIPLSHEGLSPSDATVLRERAEGFRRYALDFTGISVYFASEPKELTSKIVPLVLSANRQVVIRK